MKTLFIILIAIASVAIIISVLLQESKSEGIASLTGETNIGGHGAKKTRDNYLNQVVVIAAVIFIVSALALAIIK